MKKFIVPIVILLALVSFGASKMKVYIDYDQNADFSSIKTFKWFDTLATSVDDSAPSMHRLMRALIMKKLVEGGMKKVEENPDVFVTYHTNPKEALRMNTTNYMYHYAAGWWVNPYWGSGMDISSYTRGTLIIDIWDARTEEALWRGVVMGVVPEEPQKAEKTIVKALNKLSKEWRKMRKKGS